MVGYGERKRNQRTILARDGTKSRAKRRMTEFVVDVESVILE